jgi:hypothetical protein
MCNVAARLVPDDAFNFSPRVLQRLLDLGVFEVIALEDWLTKRAVVGATSGEAGASTALTGSDKRAYEDALIGMVGGWETLLQNVISSFGLERRPGRRAPGESWTVFSASFPVLQTHLNNTAYFFAASVWNDDALGASRFSDLLLRWLQPFYANLQSSYLFENAVLFTPDLLVQDWASVRTALAHHVRFSPEQMAPGPVSGLVLWEAHADVVCLSGLVALHWPALTHLRQRSRLARSCTKVLGGCFMAARSMSFGVLQREHRISSQAKPPLMAWSMVGDGSIGSPSDHIRSFQLSHSSLTACCSMFSALARISADCAARILVIARALPL